MSFNDTLRVERMFKSMPKRLSRLGGSDLTSQRSIKQTSKDSVHTTRALDDHKTALTTRMENRVHYYRWFSSKFVDPDLEQKCAPWPP